MRGRRPWKFKFGDIPRGRFICCGFIVSPHIAAADGTRASADHVEDIRRNAIPLSFVVIVSSGQIPFFLTLLNVQGKLS